MRVSEGGGSEREEEEEEEDEEEEEREVQGEVKVRRGMKVRVSEVSEGEGCGRREGRAPPLPRGE